MHNDDSSKFIIGLIIVVIIIVSFSFDHSRYDKLQQEYDELDEKYVVLEDSYSTAIGKCEDPLAVLYCYFEYEDDITFEEAHDAFKIINQQISQFY